MSAASSSEVRFLTKTLPPENPDPTDRCGICWVPLTDAVAGHTVFGSMAARAAAADAGRVADVAKHFFHEECIQRALAVRRNCPTCTRPVINAARLFPDGIIPPPPPAEPDPLLDVFLLPPDMIILAAQEGNLPLAERLIEAGGIPEDYRFSALLRALHRGHTAIVQTLLRAGGFLEYRQETDLLLAAQEGNLPLVVRLIEAGEISEYYQDIALLMATENNHVAIVEALLTTGSISEEFKGRALIAASQRGLLPIVQALLRAGKISDEDLREAIDEAKIAGHGAIAQTIQQALPFWSVNKALYLLGAIQIAIAAKLLWDERRRN